MLFMTYWIVLLIEFSRDPSDAGDFNGHVGKVANGYEGVHGGHCSGLRNTEGEHILAFAAVHDLVLGNTYFHKKDNHPITYHSVVTVAKYITFLSENQILNRLVIPGEEVATQHGLLVSDMKQKFVKQTKKGFTPKLRIGSWKIIMW